MIHNSSFVTHTCLAADLEGSFTTVVGEIKVKRAKSTEWVTAEENMPVYSGDQIKTAGKSEAEITFDEGTVIRLEPYSFITVEETLLEEKEKTKKFVFKANSGRVLSNLEKLTQPKSKFQVSGPGGVVAAARGTEFVFEVGKDETVEVAVFGGKVSVKNEKVAPEKEVLVEEEKETVVRPGYEPAGPRSLTEKFLKYREEKIRTFHERVARNRSRIEEIRRRKLEWVERKKEKRQEKIEEKKKLREEKIERRLERKGGGGKTK